MTEQERDMILAKFRLTAIEWAKDLHHQDVGFVEFIEALPIDNSPTIARVNEYCERYGDEEGHYCAKCPFVYEDLNKLLGDEYNKNRCSIEGIKPFNYNIEAITKVIEGK